MAEKEATVYVVDVGKSTAQKHENGETKLNFALTYVWDKVTSIMALDRKTTLQGVVAVRTDETDNELGNDPDYHHISVLQHLKALSLSELRDLQTQIVSSNTDAGDAISALVIAIHMIEKTCKKLKYIRRIVMVTSGRGSWSEANLDEISRKLKDEGIELLVLGVDFGPESDDVMKTERSKEVLQNEALIRRLVPEDEDARPFKGVFASIAEAIEELGIPRLKSVRPVPSFKGQLLLGDPSNYDDALCIDVERYPRTMLRKAPTASAFAAKDASQGDDAEAQSSATVKDEGDGGDLAVVRNQRMYQVIDASLPDGKKEIPFEELAKGYEYGRTAVHVSESDMPILKMDTISGLEIVGFIPAENFDRYMALSRSNVILAQRSNTKAIMALSSLVHALHELSSVAIARLVTKSDHSPELVLLAPTIEPEAEYLVDVALPFAEDVRGYGFPPLDRVVLASGKSLSVHRHLPDASLQSSMDAYVEAMDLDSHVGEDEADAWDPSAFAGHSENPYDAFTPVPHRIDAAIRHRASHPSSATISPPYPILTKYSSPPSTLVPSEALQSLIDAAAVKKVPPQSTATRRQRARESAATTVSGLDVGALLAKRTPAAPRVDPENPIPSFRQMLDTTRDPEGIKKAAQQFGEVIEERVRKDVGGRDESRVLEEMGTLRGEMVEMEEPGIWNEWAKAFREKVLSGELGGERRELWWKVRGQGSQVGLIEGGRDGVSKEEADGFWSLKL